MASLDRVRILVLGDSGVGKTSLVHLISKGQPLTQLSYTIGAQVEVKLHEYKEGTPNQKTYWIGEGRTRKSFEICFDFQTVQNLWTWAAFIPTETPATSSTTTPRALSSSTTSATESRSRTSTSGSGSLWTGKGSFNILTLGRIKSRQLTSAGRPGTQS